MRQVHAKHPQTALFHGLTEDPGLAAGDVQPAWGSLPGRFVARVIGPADGHIACMMMTGRPPVRHALDA